MKEAITGLEKRLMGAETDKRLSELQAEMERAAGAGRTPADLLIHMLLRTPADLLIHMLLAEVVPPLTC